MQADNRADKGQVAADAGQAAWMRGREANTSLGQLVAYVECLWWLAAADEYFVSRDGAAYKDTRSADRAGQALPGVVWARNKASHDPMLPFQLGEFGGHWGKTWGSLWGEWKWRRRTDMTIHEPNRNWGESEYISHLEGRLIAETLSEVLGFLDRYQGGTPL